MYDEHEILITVKREMDPDSVKSTLSNLAFGNVMAAAARDYQKVIPFTIIPIFSQIYVTKIGNLFSK